MMESHDRLRLPRAIIPFTIAAGIGSFLWGTGVAPAEWAAGIGAVSGAALSSGIGRTILANKAAMATGGLAFCLAMGMALPASLGSLGLSILAYTLKYPVGIMLAGFGGLLFSRMVRASWGSNRTHKRYKSLFKEAAGTSAGITGFLAGTFAGPALSGSPHFDMDRIQALYQNLGVMGGIQEIHEQKNKILISAYEALNTQLSGGKTIWDVWNNISGKVMQTQPDHMDAFFKAVQQPDIKAALIVLATSVAMAIPAYMTAKHLTFRKEDYPGGLDRQHG